MAIRYDSPDGPSMLPWCDSCGQQIPPHGDGEPCFYCDEPCEGWAANPSRWPVALPHRSEPGIVKWHHMSCVSRRLFENIFVEGGTLEQLYQDAMKWREHQKTLDATDHVGGESDVAP